MPNSHVSLTLRMEHLALVNTDAAMPPITRIYLLITRVLLVIKALDAHMVPKLQTVLKTCKAAQWLQTRPLQTQDLHRFDCSQTSRMVLGGGYMIRNSRHTCLSFS